MKVTQDKLLVLLTGMLQVTDACRALQECDSTVVRETPPLDLPEIDDETFADLIGCDSTYVDADLRQLYNGTVLYLDNGV
jgi:hypothetical protein